MQTFFLILFVSVLSLSGEKETSFYNDLESDTVLNRYFSPGEVKDLAKLVDFVDDIAFETSGKSDINEAYHSFFDTVRNNLITEKLSYNPPISDEVRFSFLENLKTSTFEAIWRLDTVMNSVEYRDTILTDVKNVKMLSLNWRGKYMDYIEELGESDELFFDVHDNTKAMGDLSTTNLIRFISHANNYDFTVVENRLLAVICIWSFEENVYKKLDRKYKTDQRN